MSDERPEGLSEGQRLKAIREFYDGRPAGDIAFLLDIIGRWEQCGRTLIKFFPDAKLSSELDLPDFLWREVPTRLREQSTALARLREQADEKVDYLSASVMATVRRAESAEAKVTRLREERDRLRTALVSVTEYMDRAGGDNCGMSECPWCKQQSLDQPYEHSGDCELELARAALSSPSASEQATP